MTVPQNITAIIYDKRGRPLSVGKNSYVRTHVHQARIAAKVGLPHKQYLHAEVAAIVKCKQLDRAHKIFVTRIDANGKPMLAKPCPICQEAIRLAGIKIVEHT